jgi:hypothetical protein
MVTSGIRFLVLKLVPDTQSITRYCMLNNDNTYEVFNYCDSQHLQVVRKATKLKVIQTVTEQEMVRPVRARLARPIRAQSVLPFAVASLLHVPSSLVCNHHPLSTLQTAC